MYEDTLIEALIVLVDEFDIEGMTAYQCIAELYAIALGNAEAETERRELYVKAIELIDVRTNIDPNMDAWAPQLVEIMSVMNELSETVND